MRNAGKIMIVAAAAVSLVACSPSRQAPSEIPSGEQPVHTPASASIVQSASASGEHSGGEHAGKPGECTAEDIQVKLEGTGQRPQVTLPHDCTAPSEVLTHDVESGIGDGAEPGSTVEINYEVIGWSNGQVASSTYEQDEPISVTLGQSQSQAIQGWDEALADIKQTGTRVIVLPPDLGYGAQSGNPLAQDTIVIVATATEVITP